MAPSYRNFRELSRKEVERTDYRIRSRRGQDSILVMAPHGGKIEPGTSEIADAIAANKYAFYSFEGIKSDGNGILHIPSSLFDEPIAEEAARKAELVVTIHGHLDRKDEFVMVGGLDDNLKATIEYELKIAGFQVRKPPRELSGRGARNICNRGAKGKGVQFEISRKLRDLLKEDAGRLHDFAQAIQRAIRSAEGTNS